MQALAVTLKSRDWRLVGQRVSHSAAITAQMPATTMLIARPVVVCGPAEVNLTSLRDVC